MALVWEMVITIRQMLLDIATGVVAWLKHCLVPMVLGALDIPTKHFLKIQNVKEIWIGIIIRLEEILVMQTPKQIVLFCVILDTSNLLQ